MPKISKTAHEQSTDSPIVEIINTLTQEISISNNPTFVCGVNRKINIGNFENIDIYAGITLPLANVSLEDKEQLEKVIRDAAEYGFSLMSKETGERYLLIKESQQGN